MSNGAQHILFRRKYAHFPAGERAQARAADNAQQMKRQIPEQGWLLSCNSQDDKRQPHQDAQPDQSRSQTIACQSHIRDLLFGYHVQKASSAAVMVASITSSECAVETNPASNCDGAR